MLVLPPAPPAALDCSCTCRNIRSVREREDGSAVAPTDSASGVLAARSVRRSIALALKGLMRGGLVRRGGVATAGQCLTASCIGDELFSDGEWFTNQWKM
jgi:hypothetical protein